MPINKLRAIKRRPVFTKTEDGGDSGHLASNTFNNDYKDYHKYNALPRTEHPFKEHPWHLLGIYYPTEHVYVIWCLTCDEEVAIVT